MIPRRFVRSVPAQTTVEVERWWAGFKALHPGWRFDTYRDPVDPGLFPITSPMWHHCANGAQMAGLLRLEALWSLGGVYVDSDVEPCRSFEPLMGLSGFAAWEDERVVPDAVLGASRRHPALEALLTHALAAVAAGQGAWESGPGATTAILPGRSDWLLLPPGSFFPYHYSGLHRKPATKEALAWRRRGLEMAAAKAPWCFAIHHWAKSWIPD